MKGYTTTGVFFRELFFLCSQLVFRKELCMIRINGTPVELTEGMTLQTYLDQNQYQSSRVAVERNGTIVPRAQYGSIQLQEDDELEIVHFVGGG